MIRTTSIGLLIFVCVMAGCGAWSNSIDTNEEAKVWFDNYSSELESILGVLIAHPNIRRVEDMRMEFIPKYGDFGAEDQAAYDQLLLDAEKVSISAIEVSRRGAKKEGKLLGVEFLLHSKGLLTSGSALTVEYIPDFEVVENGKSHGVMYEALNSQQWYIVTYQN